MIRKSRSRLAGVYSRRRPADAERLGLPGDRQVVLTVDHHLALSNPALVSALLKNRSPGSARRSWREAPSSRRSAPPSARPCQRRTGQPPLPAPASPLGDLVRVHIQKLSQFGQRLGLATMTIAWVVFRENVDRRLLLGAASILAGGVVLSCHGQGLRADTGGLLIVAACLAWSIDNNLTRNLSSADPVAIALIKGLAAGGVNLTLALILGAHLPSVGMTGAALVVGFLERSDIGLNRVGGIFESALF